MARGRLASVVLGCLFLAGYCGRGLENWCAYKSILPCKVGVKFFPEAGPDALRGPFSPNVDVLTQVLVCATDVPLVPDTAAPSWPSGSARGPPICMLATNTFCTEEPVSAKTCRTESVSKRTAKSRGADGKVEVSTTSEVEVEVGRRAVLACNFSAPENVTYVNWYYMDKSERKKIISVFRGSVHIDESDFRGRVSLTEELALAIESVALQDAKTYVCQVGAGSAGVGENRSELHVFKAPEAPELDVDPHLTASPDIQKVAECISRNGYPVPSIAWYKDGSLLEQNERADVNIRPIITKESSGLVTIRSILLAQVTKEDRKAFFRCQVNYNLMGVNKTLESESFQINVYYPSENITLEIQAPTGEVKEGDNVTLFCKADGNPPPLYTFFRTGGHEVESPGALSGELILENVQKENSDVYQCQAIDSQSTDILNAEVNLFVNYINEPTITREPSRHALRRGDNLTLTCHGEGSKHLEFQWLKREEVVKKGHRLSFTHLVPRDSDNYSCQVTMPDIPGLARSKKVSVAVHAEPEMVDLNDVVYVQGGELLNLTCSVFSVPQLFFKWSVQGGKIVHLPPDHYLRTSLLSIVVTQELMDEGINCTASNKLGTSVHHFSLETRSEEPVATGVPPSSGEDDTSGFRANQTAAPEETQNGTAGSSPEQGNETSGFRFNQTAAPQTPEGAQNGTAGSSPDKAEQKPESQGVIIVAVVVCVLLLAVLGSVLYFLHKKGKLPCSRSGKQEITKPDAHKDKIVVEVKSDKLPEEAELLQDANGEKRSTGDQGERYIDLRN
ncbi:hypothetical protein lerEdw1_007618 [Lerista edwardsae]|nr:hypothetical protein lerEdw1_007618 [Lerista edwardsae]